MLAEYHMKNTKQTPWAGKEKEGRDDSDELAPLSQLMRDIATRTSGSSVDTALALILLGISDLSSDDEIVIAIDDLAEWDEVEVATELAAAVKP